MIGARRQSLHLYMGLGGGGVSSSDGASALLVFTTFPWPMGDFSGRMMVCSAVL